MIPLHDSNYAPGVPIVTWGIIIICFFVHLSGNAGDGDLATFYHSYGIIPSVLLTDAQLRPDLYLLNKTFYFINLITSLFVHGSWGHLIGNMLFLWVFGDNVESATGKVKFVVFYLLCGIAASLVHAYMALASGGGHIPLIGASGAISGVLAAYLLLWPRAKLWVWVGIPLRLPAYLIIFFWICVQIYNAVSELGGGVAWWAHVGGFLAGIVAIGFFKSSKIPWFGKGVTQAETQPQQPTRRAPPPPPSYDAQPPDSSRPTSGRGAIPSTPPSSQESSRSRFPRT